MSRHGELPILWYENEAGERWIPPTKWAADEPPPRLVRLQRVLVAAASGHWPVAPVPSVNVFIDFPDPPEGFKYQWFRNPCELHDSICTIEGQIARGTQTWNPRLALLMVRPTWWERLRQVWRGWGVPPPLFSLADAIITAATSCERCLNVLHWRYGTGDGYPKGSFEWLKTNTECDYCKPPRPESFQSNEPKEPEANGKHPAAERDS
jgi:hypothetical protein